MPLTVFQLPGYLRDAARRAGDRGPKLAAEGMAQAYQRYVVRSMKGPPPSPPGSPPARRTGTLARSVRWTPAVSTGAYRATSTIAPHTVYARIQQQGGTIRAKHMAGDTGYGRALNYAGAHRRVSASGPGFLRFTIDGTVHYARQVTLPARPYMVLNSDVKGQMRDAAVYALKTSGVLLGGEA